MKKFFVGVLLSSAVLSTSVTADAALNAMLRITGKNQGVIRGSAIQKGREGAIEVIAAEHQVRNDGAKKVHGVFTITKEVDRSTPMLYKALVTNETLESFELAFYAPNRLGTAGGAGVETQHYTVKLVGARVVDIKFRMPNTKNPDLSRYAEYEEVSFTYDAITWTSASNPASTSDTR